MAAGLSSYDYLGETRCPIRGCTHQPGDLLAAHLIDFHTREIVAAQLADLIELVRLAARLTR